MAILKYLNIWKWLWSKVWLMAESFNLDLGRIAPWVFAQMMGNSNHAKVVSVYFICKCGHEHESSIDTNIHFLKCVKCGRVGQWVKEK